MFISGEEKVVITFESRFLLGKLPSKLTFAYAVLNQMRLSSLTNGIVCINKRVIDVPNKMVISQHDCVYEQCTSDLNIPKRVATCKLYIKYCKARSYENVLSTYCTLVRNLTSCFGNLNIIVNFA